MSRWLTSDFRKASLENWWKRQVLPHRDVKIAQRNGSSWLTRVNTKSSRSICDQFHSPKLNSLNHRQTLSTDTKVQRKKLHEFLRIKKIAENKSAEVSVPVFACSLNAKQVFLLGYTMIRTMISKVLDGRSLFEQGRFRFNDGTLKKVDSSFPFPTWCFLMYLARRTGTYAEILCSKAVQNLRRNEFFFPTISGNWVD